GDHAGFGQLHRKRAKPLSYCLPCLRKREAEKIWWAFRAHWVWLSIPVGLLTAILVLRWRSSEALIAAFVSFWLLFRPLAVVIHELGHALAAKLVGFQVLRVRLG